MVLTKGPHMPTCIPIYNSGISLQEDLDLTQGHEQIFDFRNMLTGSVHFCWEGNSTEEGEFELLVSNFTGEDLDKYVPFDAKQLVNNGCGGHLMSLGQNFITFRFLLVRYKPNAETTGTFSYAIVGKRHGGF